MPLGREASSLLTGLRGIWSIKPDLATSSGEVVYWSAKLGPGGGWIGDRKTGLGSLGGSGSTGLLIGVLLSSSNTVHRVAALSGLKRLLAFSTLMVMLVIGAGSLGDLVSLRPGEEMLALWDLSPAGTWRISSREVSFHHSS